MTHSRPFDELLLRQEAAEERHRRLTEFGHQWDHTIRNELQRLAHVLWSTGHALGLFPAHRVRLRHQVEEETWGCWIERDIPPMTCTAVRRTG